MIFLSLSYSLYVQVHYLNSLNYEPFDDERGGKVEFTLTFQNFYNLSFLHLI
jgi:hypothetical protein